jgi:hypothetical protein
MLILTFLRANRNCGTGRWPRSQAFGLQLGVQFVFLCWLRLRVSDSILDSGKTYLALTITLAWRSCWSQSFPIVSDPPPFSLQLSTQFPSLILPWHTLFLSLHWHQGRQLGFELRALFLLGRRSTIWTTKWNVAPFCSGYFWVMSHKLFAWAGLKHDPPDLSFPST